MAGDKFDEAIVTYVKKKYNLLIGERTAEEIKMKIGSAFPTEDTINSFVEIKGRNLIDGLPKNVTIHADEVRDALMDSVMVVVEAIKDTLEQTPPELAADIIDRGLCSPAAACPARAWTSWWPRRRASPSTCGTAPGLRVEGHRQKPGGRAAQGPVPPPEEVRGMASEKTERKRVDCCRAGWRQSRLTSQGNKRQRRPRGEGFF